MRGLRERRGTRYRSGGEGEEFSVVEGSPPKDDDVVGVGDVTMTLAGEEMGTVIVKEEGRDEANARFWDVEGIC